MSCIRQSRVALALLAPLALSACLSMSPRAAYELSRFDPFAADPRGIAVAVKTDKNLHLRTGDVVLRVALADPDAQKAFDETFHLAVAEGPGDPLFSAELARTEHVITATFAAADIPRYEAVQERARAARAEKTGRSRGTLAVTMKGGCRSGGLPAGISVRTYMRTAPGESYFPLTGDIALKSILGALPIEAIPPCAPVPGR